MSGEAALWQYVRDGMRGRWDAQRHEDKLSSGIPDVSYATAGVDGWVELKRIAKWPVRGGPVRLDLRTNQVRWLQDRGKRGGGHCFVLARVEDDFLLFPWPSLHLVGKDPPKNEMTRLAAAEWGGRRIDFDELTLFLTTSYRSLVYPTDPRLTKAWKDRG